MNSHVGQTSDRGEVARCLEELDVLACKRAQKLTLTAKEKSQVLTYEFVAQPPPINATTVLDKAKQIKKYIAGQPEPKRSDMRALHRAHTASVTRMQYGSSTVHRPDRLNE